MFNNLSLRGPEAIYTTVMTVVNYVYNYVCILCRLSACLCVTSLVNQCFGGTVKTKYLGMTPSLFNSQNSFNWEPYFNSRPPQNKQSIFMQLCGLGCQKFCPVYYLWAFYFAKLFKFDSAIIVEIRNYLFLRIESRQLL